MELFSTDGRPRPLEHDALRLLVVICELGEPPGELPAREGCKACLGGEGRLQALDHLVRHPNDLAFVLLDRLTWRDGKRLIGFADRIRRLVFGPDGRRLGRRPSWSGAQRLQATPWKRFDDCLAVLMCRDLLRVEPRRSADGAAELLYLATDRGARLVAEPLTRDPAFAVVVERCRLLSMSLPDLAARDFQDLFDQVEERLQSFCRDEQLATEDDVLSPFFQAVCGEPL